jgi:hypothetical protein
MYGRGFEELRGHGELRAVAAAEEAVRRANEEAFVLDERLPFGAPDDLYLVASPPLLREVHRNLIEVFEHTPGEANQKRAAVAGISSVLVEDFDADHLDRLAPSRKDDLVIHTAFAGDADVIVTDDRGILAAGEGTKYERLDGHVVHAYSFERFAETLETSTFSLERVPELLSVRFSDVRLPFVP